MATNPFSLPSSYQQELTGIDRRRQLAQSLLQNSMQPQQGQMVSGHYVSPGIAGGLGQILGAYLANKGINTADQQEKMVTDRYNTDRNKVLAEALQAREGVPAQTIDNPQPEGVDHAGTVQPAVPGSNKKMAEILAGSQFPDFQQKGVDLLLQNDKPVDMFSKVDPKDYTPESIAKFATTKNYADLMPVRKREVVNGQVIDPYAVNPGQAINDPNKPFGIGPNGGLAPNLPYQEYEKDKAAKGASKTVVNNSFSTEKKYGESFAGKIADTDAAMLDTARKAPDLAQRAAQVKQLLASGKVITGSGADYRLALGKAAGLVGLSDKETIANTEALTTDLARNTLDSIKSSGLGAGNGFSNADREFLNKAVGGQITLEASTLDRLATLAYKAAQASANKWNERAATIPKSALEGTGIGAVAPIPEYQGQKQNGQSNPKIDLLLKKYGQ